MKNIFLSKKLLSVLIICILMASIFVPMAFASEPMYAPGNNEYVKFKNADFPTKAMNVYNWTAQDGNSVTLYTYSGSSTQTWYNTQIGNTVTYRLESASNRSVALTMGSSTQAIVSNWSSMNDDNTIGYLGGAFGTIVYLPETDLGRKIGTPGDYGDHSPTPLYWYYGNATIQENWIFL